MSPLAQNPPSKLKIFFVLNYTTPPVITGFELLFSSICCRVMAGQNLPSKGKLCLFLKVFGLGSKLGFWPIILATDMLASQSRVLLTRMFLTNFEPKEWVNGLGPMAGQSWPKLWKHAFFVTSPPENPHRNRKSFFFDFDYKTCWIHRGFEQHSSSIVWRVIGLQSSAKKVTHEGLKRFPSMSTQPSKSSYYSVECI